MAKHLLNMNLLRRKAMVEYDNSKTFLEFELQRKIDQKNEIIEEIKNTKKELDIIKGVIRQLPSKPQITKKGPIRSAKDFQIKIDVE